jgi:aryl-alcohol dehydrogenase-like predicted oxidoreductase
MEEPPSDWRASLPRYSKENLEKNQRVLEQIADVAKKYDCTPAQLSLAWLFHKGEQLGVSVVPIPGSTKIANVISNFGSTKVIISNEDAQALESSADQVSGERASDWYIASTIESQV